MPVLSKVDARLGAGTLTSALLINVWVPPPGPAVLNVALASRPTRPGLSPEDGAVTLKLADAAAPAATVPRAAGPDGETVHPAGALSKMEALRSGCRVGLLSVAFTVNVPSASAEDGTAASDGCGLDGGPYTAAE